MFTRLSLKIVLRAGYKLFKNNQNAKRREGWVLTFNNLIYKKTYLVWKKLRRNSTKIKVFTFSEIAKLLTLSNNVNN